MPDEALQEWEAYRPLLIVEVFFPSGERMYATREVAIFETGGWGTSWGEVWGTL